MVSKLVEALQNSHKKPVNKKNGTAGAGKTAPNKQNTDEEAMKSAHQTLIGVSETQLKLVNVEGGALLSEIAAGKQEARARNGGGLTFFENT